MSIKFELTDLRKKFSDTEFINDLRSVANSLGKTSLKMRDYSKKNGAKYSPNAISKRFGKWESVLKKAGLKTEKNIKGMEYGERSLKEEVLIVDLVRVANELNNSNISIADYERFGKYTAVTMHDRFGSWNKAKQKANLEVSRVISITSEELFQNIIELWTLLGRQPKYSEVISPNSKYHAATYTKRFGSWKAALEEFIKYVNSDNNDEGLVEADSLIRLNNVVGNINEQPKEIKIKKTPR